MQQVISNVSNVSKAMINQLYSLTVYIPASGQLVPKIPGKRRSPIR